MANDEPYLSKDSTEELSGLTILDAVCAEIGSKVVESKAWPEALEALEANKTNMVQSKQPMCWVLRRVNIDVPTLLILRVMMKLLHRLREIQPKRL